ncbi:MAG: acyl-CoA dehydratase activase [Dehalococcoidia bacterium]
MSYFLGMDIGSVSAKLAVVDTVGSVLYLDTQKITRSPRSAIISLLNRLSEKFDLNLIAAAGLSGSGKSIIPRELEWVEYSSPLAIAAGLLHFYPDAGTIIQIGGQSSLVIELEDGLKKPWRVTTNPLCAAGTGRFLEQQAYRLGIDIDDFASLAMHSEGSPPRIAARCSVFAKTDLIHLQQKGAPVEAMLYALCESIARMVASLKKGVFRVPVYFLGGVAANASVARSLNDMLASRNGYQVNVVIPENYLHIEALGSALLSRGKISKSILLPESDKKQAYFEMPGLEPLKPKEKGRELKISGECNGYLGVDIGSTSTKAVILDQTGRKVLAKSYLMTAGKPVTAVKEVFENLVKDGADRVKICGAGITGSGRYLVGSLIGADLIKNEITAQTRAAADIDPEADIIEIGGQDSKLVIKRNGVVIDYQMNKACAAGTGSFIDELAEMLGVSVKDGEFSRLAFAAQHTIDLGTRCAAFMGQAVATAQQEGLPLEVITASLANSIAKNYLSKVVGNRKLGNKVILTGAVFYNLAVVSAFHQQLKGKILTVPEHNEVSGAMGAALLAKEAPGQSKFKGFREVIGAECVLSTFTCKSCDNNCTITRMQTPSEKPTFYGSRCDRYDSDLGHAKIQTFFDQREKLLFMDHRDGAGQGPIVGIPRALLVYDYAPLLIGYLNSLDARVKLSGITNSQIIHQAAELSYTDSCFPVKLLHGHAAALKDTDYILSPCSIRLGEKEGDENQKYACPLVQASPYIIRQVLDLKDRLLIPIVDFTHGPEETINNLADAAVKMGFSRSLGKKAALAGIEAQRTFEKERDILGSRLLDQLHTSGKTGVVLFTRAYMSQDSGANLGIAEKLAQLGVVPIPLDFLPLASIDPKKYSDRPYWFYESKLIAGAAITAGDPQLYGLILTNFGCGPNSFALRLVEDIMGGKPLGQLEIDEHAAEAGIVTRLEAFVDTINGFSRPVSPSGGPSKYYYRGASPVINTHKTLLIPRMASHAEVVAAAMNACGVRTIVLNESDERSLLYSNELTSGTECLPYRVCLGDFIRFYRDNGDGLKNVEGFMAGSYGPCRLGKYAIEQMRVLKEIGIDLPIRTTVSNNAYRDLNIGADFERLAWKGLVAFDHLERLLWRTRPYEREAGAANRLFKEYTGRIVRKVHNKEPFEKVLSAAASEFRALIDTGITRKPVIGINGEIFLRSNKFSNSHLVEVCESAGLEVVVSPLSEWFKYTSFRNLEDALRDSKLKKALISYIKRYVQEHDEHCLASCCRELLDTDQPSIEKLLSLSGKYISPRCGSEAVLSIGSGIDWMRDPEYAGVISVMPHGCMPGGIVAAMSDKFSAEYRKPWISLTYDGFPETNNLARITNFAEVLRYCRESDPDISHRS